MAMREERYLVSDLDGTLIPWEGINRLGSFDSLVRLNRKIREHRLRFVILTGRSFSDIQQALKDYPLPEPELIFSSSGSSLYKRKSGRWEQCLEHRSYLEKRNTRWDRDEIFRRLGPLDLLKTQGEIHQAPFKLSFFLYTLDYEPVLRDAERLLGDLNDTLTMQVYPEPDLGWCYLDLLALDADKKGALTYLASREITSPYVFAGDNWNDRSAFLSHHPSILVNNTPDSLKKETVKKNPRQFIARGLTKDRDGKFADGVLEGLEHLGWVI